MFKLLKINQKVGVVMEKNGDRVIFRMPKELREQAEAKANSLGLNMSSFIRFVIIDWLKTHKDD